MSELWRQGRGKVVAVAVWIESIDKHLVNTAHVFSFAISCVGKTDLGADRYAVKAYSSHFSPVWLSSGYLAHREADAFMGRLTYLLTLPHDNDIVITQDSLKAGDES